MARPSYMVVDLAALIANYQWARQLAPQAQTMAVVKANAYGHGAVACARALQPSVPAFAVVTRRGGGDLDNLGCDSVAARRRRE